MALLFLPGNIDLFKCMYGMGDPSVNWPEREIIGALKVSGDPYAKSAEWYDTFIEPLAGKLRRSSVEMFPLRVGMSVLDIGCGTGTHLSIYQRAGCRVFGIDSSPAMLDVAQAKLAGHARLYLGDASQMPFPDESFDLILAVLLLHETPAPTRSLIVNEARRIMKRSGRFLVVDYHPGPVQSPKGWLYRIVVTSLEILAGGEHLKGYRGFMADGGLPPLLAENNLLVERKRIVGGGTVGLYLLRAS